MKRSLLLCAATAALVGGAPAWAAGDRVPAAEAAGSPPMSLSPLQNSAAPPLLSAPISILPPGAAIPGRAPLDEPARKAARLAAVPVPRLRPAYNPGLAGSEVRSAVAGLPGDTADIAFEFTGSIPEDPAPAATVPPVPEPPPVSEPAATDPAPVSDDLLGDPTDFLLPTSGDMNPRSPAPAGIAAPRVIGVPIGVATETPLAGRSPHQPFELVRTLQALQDKVAQGSTQALTAQQVLRVEIDRTFAAAGPAVWRDYRNAAAAVTYVLSGGKPDILSGLVLLDPPAAIDQGLLNGVLAYAQGKESEALPLLEAIDARALPASMGAQVALAQSALAVRASPERAMQLLATARLLAPGTLVEEAAIRRQIFVADQLKDDKAVQSLARQYLDRFRHSVYAGNFRSRFAAALSHSEFVDDEARFPQLDDMLASVEPKARCELYLTVALASVTKGRLTAGRLAAERASALAAGGSVEEARARLYHAAVLVAMPKLFDTAASDLAGVRLDLLAPYDQSLHAMVAATLDGVRSGTVLASESTAGGTSSGDQPQPPLIVRAADALKAADALIEVAAK